MFSTISAQWMQVQLCFIWICLSNPCCLSCQKSFKNILLWLEDLVAIRKSKISPTKLSSRKTCKVRLPSISTAVSSFLKALLQKYLSSCGFANLCCQVFSFCFMAAHKTSHFFLFFWQLCCHQGWHALRF